MNLKAGDRVEVMEVDGLASFSGGPVKAIESIIGLVAVGAALDGASLGGSGSTSGGSGSSSGGSGSSFRRVGVEVRRVGVEFHNQRGEPVRPGRIRRGAVRQTT